MPLAPFFPPLLLLCMQMATVENIQELWEAGCTFQVGCCSHGGARAEKLTLGV
jgi:hypothetical protein